MPPKVLHFTSANQQAILAGKSTSIMNQISFDLSGEFTMAYNSAKQANMFSIEKKMRSNCGYRLANKNEGCLFVM